MLSGHDLSCVRGGHPLFARLDLSVEPGHWLHVRGANGTGKTSLLRLLAGLAVPDTGQVRWCGRSIGQAGPDFRRELIFLGHRAAVKDELTAHENLELAAALDGCELAQPQTLSVLRRFGLRGREDLPVRFLSAGQKRRVLLARLVTRKARLWILDEPFTALDANAVNMLAAVVGEHLSDGGMAVITSHQAVPIAAGQVVDL